jgi:predicted phage terminase large subunit-like protein
VMSTRSNDPKRRRRVVVMQRVHDRDLAGHLLETGDWHHLCLPEEYEPRVYVKASEAAPEIQPHDACPIAKDPRRREGELLWPARSGPQENAQDKRELGAYAYAAQFQQRPSPRTGAVFDVALIRALPPDFDTPGVGGLTLRQRLPVVMYWDLAFSERTSADYMAAVTAAVDVATRAVYLTNAWRTRVLEDPTRANNDAAGLAPVLADHIVQTRPALVGIEEGAYRQAATQDLIRRVQLRLAGRHAVGIYPVKATADKVFRARLPAGRAEAGLVYADRRAPWWPDFETELRRFPKGAHDDLVDAFSGCVQLAVETPQTPKVKRLVFGGR